MSAGDFWKSCYTCRDYAEHRREVIAGPLTAKAIRDGRDVVEVVDEFMASAHAMHLGGQPLRPGGPTRVTDPFVGQVAALMSPAARSIPDPARVSGPNENAQPPRERNR